MRNIISFMHISLDGFVAGPNGEMDWIILDQEVFSHISRRIGGTDTALYGRVTYEMMEAYWPGAGDKPGASRHDIEHAAWYSKAHKLVLSGSLIGMEKPDATIISDAVAATLQGIKQQEGTEILLFGSPSATHSLMEAGLIDSYWLFVNPVLLGKGIPLFSAITHKTNLNLLQTRSFDCGVTELSYAVKKP